MRSIVPAPPPNDYVEKRREYEPILHRDGFSKFLSEIDVRRHLWNEQNGHCAYCECPIREPDHPKVHHTKIEHFHPFEATIWGADCAECSGTTSTVEARSELRNLLLVCEGNMTNSMPTTCDTLKDSTDICARFRNPKGRPEPMLVSIDAQGRALAAPSLPAQAQGVVDSVLNLNAEHLVEGRRSIISEYRKAFVARSRRAHGLSDADKSKLRDTYRKFADEKAYGATYLSIAERI